MFSAVLSLVFPHSIQLKATLQEALKLRKEVIWQIAVPVVGLSSRAGKDTGPPTLACTVTRSLLPSPTSSALPKPWPSVCLQKGTEHIRYSISTKSMSDSK